MTLQPMDVPNERKKKRWLIVGLAGLLATAEAAIALGLLPRALAVVRPLAELVQEALEE